MQAAPPSLITDSIKSPMHQARPKCMRKVLARPTSMSAGHTGHVRRLVMVPPCGQISKSNFLGLPLFKQRAAKGSKWRRKEELLLRSAPHLCCETTKRQAPAVKGQHTCNKCALLDRGCTSMALGVSFIVLATRVVSRGNLEAW